MVSESSDPVVPARYLSPLRGWSWSHVERFDGGNFGAVFAVEKRVKDLGMTYGSMQRDDPIACYSGAEYVSKWRGLSLTERLQMDAAIVGDKRNGPVWVLFREVPRE